MKNPYSDGMVMSHAAYLIERMAHLHISQGLTPNYHITVSIHDMILILSLQYEHSRIVDGDATATVVQSFVYGDLEDFANRMWEAEQGFKAQFREIKEKHGSYS